MPVYTYKQAPQISRDRSIEAALLDDPDWRVDIWADVITQVADETGLATLPTSCPWDLHQVCG